MGKPKRPNDAGDTHGGPSESHAHQAPSKRPRQFNMGNETTGGGSKGHNSNKKKKCNKNRRNNSGGGSNRPFDLMVKISRVELLDDYRHVPASLNHAELDLKESSLPGVASGAPDKEEADKSGLAVDEKQEIASDMAIGPIASAVDVTETVPEGEAVSRASKPADASVNVCVRVSAGADTTPSTNTSTSPTAKPKRQPFIKIIKTKSAKSRPKFQHDNFDRNYKPLPDGDCGDGIKNPHPKDEVPDKFWAQRRRLFSRYDDGIQLDKESWYSVTPEAIANHVAKKMAEDCQKAEPQKKRGAVILDAFCGCGGNAVAFARLPPEKVSLVVCIDVDKSKLKMAAHNAALYGIEPDRIVFIQADAVSAMKYGYANGKCIMNTSNLRDSTDEDDRTDSCASIAAEKYQIGGLELLPPRIDTVFLSPPWGGMDYGNTGKQGYDVAKNIQLHPWGGSEKKTGESAGATTGNRDVKDGEELLQIAANVSATKSVAYFLPRNTNGISLGRAALKAGYRESIEMEQNFLNGKFKTVTAYLSFRK